MIVNAQAVFESVIEKELRMKYYADIMKSARVVDVSTDRDFQRAYTYFYRVRRDASWRDAYFRYMQDHKETGASFESVLIYMCEQTGNVEPSFSSKLIATLDPDAPIWDSIVFRHLGLELTGHAKEEKLSNAVGLYEQLKKWYTDFLKTDAARENIEMFDAVLPRYKWLSDTKKIDFLLWGNRD